MQIFLNYLTVFIIPAIVGLVARLIFIKAEKGWAVSVTLGGISVAMALVNLFVDSHGNEAQGLLLIAALVATAVSLLCGAIGRLVRKKGVQE